MITIKICLALYLLISSVALVVFLYRKYLQFLSPKKGYMMGMLSLALILSFDVGMFTFTSFKIKEWKKKSVQQTTPVLRFYAAEYPQVK